MSDQWQEFRCTCTGEEEIGTRVIAKNRSQSAAQQRPFEPKRRLLDLDEGDEILDEEDELDAELTRLMIEKLKQTQTQTNCQERVCPVHAVFPQGQH